MAWKRGTQNNQAGEIRKGHVKEFLLPRARELGIGSAKLRIIGDRAPGVSSALALIGSESFPEELARYVDEATQTILLHAHAHPRSVLRAALFDQVPPGCISLSQSQLINSKVCVNDAPCFTAFTGSVYAFDAREGRIGDTEVRYQTKPPSCLDSLTLQVRLLSPATTGGVEVLAETLERQLAADLYGAIVTVDEVYVVEQGNVKLVCRVVGVSEEKEQEEEDEEEDECYRGVVLPPATRFLTAVDPSSPPGALTLVGSNDGTGTAANPSSPRDLVDVLTSDGEVFPVRRALLLPCIALTAVVQRGAGKYKQQQHAGDATALAEPRQVIEVNVECCTFDRVLLYLQHARRASRSTGREGQSFVFDPLLAHELLQAATTLQIQGLIDCANQCLGTFEERVRRRYIRWEEVLRQNAAGTRAFTETGERGTTWLVMLGAVYDITRWLPEHPGGSLIIPQHALDTDCTLMFEIFHASRQSFLYLREFYLGELHPNDASLVPKPQDAEPPSEMFLKHLHAVTAPWRLRPSDMVDDSATLLKSF